MVKYLVKETSIATASNPSFAGDVSIHYFGKGGYMVAKEGTHLEYDNYNRIEYCIDKYGYSRVCDAKRSYAYKHPENTEYWTSTVEIVAVEYEPHIVINKTAWER